MSNYVTLVGAEDVQRAASRMQQAADDMRSAANMIDNALDRHRQFLDDWLLRFENAIERLTSDKDEPVQP